MTLPVLILMAWALSNPFVPGSLPGQGAWTADTLLQDAQSSDSLARQDAPFDSIWTGGDIPTQLPTPLEQVMLSQDKLYVVLAVVLIIWIGIVVLLLRNDAHLRRLERTAEEHISDEDVL